MPTTTSLLLAAAVGLLSGSHAAIWGMYKDSIYEGFGLGRFLRSMCVGTVAAMGLQLALRLPLPDSAALILLFGLSDAAERGIVEVWKTFFRDEDQSKYFIPMAFSIGGVPVASPGARALAGAAYVAVVAACLFLISLLDRGAADARELSTTLLVGLAVGLVIAIGGAWKDAPKEGFELLKFFRSPSMTVLFALALSLLTDSQLLIAVAAIGYERAAVETYKTLRTRDAAPGKFRGKPERFPEMRIHRRHALPIFLGIWVLVLGSAFLEAGSRLSGKAARTQGVVVRPE